VSSYIPVGEVWLQWWICWRGRRERLLSGNRDLPVSGWDPVRQPLPSYIERIAATTPARKVTEKRKW